MRDLKRFSPPESIKHGISVIQLDLLDKSTLNNIPEDIDGAYYLVHSMSASDNYVTLEENSAINFRSALDKTNVRHVVYLAVL